MFSEDNLSRYLIDVGLNVEALTIMEVSQGMYTVTSPDAEMIEKVLEQVDRDEAHPVIMNGVEVYSQATKRESTENPNEYIITASIVPVSK